jgi:deazaflavin-dependent oxidoreductase (nitroreductase family)
MTNPDAVAFENQLIEEMRRNGGAIKSGPFAGEPLLVMTSTGAKSGQPRRAILNFSRDAGDYIVAGTAGGSPTAPAWLANLTAHPDVSLEAEGRTIRARGTIVEGSERDRLWDQHVATLPKFAGYPAQTGRVIPMVRLTPLTQG